MIYIYETPDCSDDIKKHDLTLIIEKLKKQVEQTQRTTYFDDFPPPYLKKKFSNFRLIASEQKIAESSIIIFHRILARGDKEYLKFFPYKFHKNLWDDKFSKVKDEILIDWLKTKKIEDPINEKIKPEDKEYEFLYDTSNTEFSNDIFIYESSHWVDSIRVDDVQSRLINIPKILIKLIENKENNKTIPLDEKYKIVYKHVKKILFLIDIIKKTDYDESKYHKEFIEENEIFINQNSRKSYPEIILCDSDIWRKIENDKEANLALSPEETNLFRSVQSDDEKSGFPLFINGRAGSGKSTILQYLFADYLNSFYKIGLDQINSPIYLTYSNKLVEKSRQIVKNLIAYSHKNLTKNKTGFKISDENINTSIQEFKSFLINLLPNEDKVRFKEINYIDFPRFKKDYLEFSSKNKVLKVLSSDISWHIIRSFIKGISIDDFLDSSDYEDLPKNEKSVTIETFKLVYDEVWNKWYKQLTNRDFWDDQDLVRHLIDNNLITPKYPAIFCDEAQDFTRIELELILRLNFYTQRKINSVTLKKVPMVFAGDPFQTINPTGFRWESLKSTYVTKFIKSLSPELRFGNPSLNYQELEFNYRSTESIVKICNSVQLLRMVLFDHKNLKPQKAWQNQKETLRPPFYYNIQYSPYINQLIREGDDLLIIVPCDEGEESDFVMNDINLKNIIDIDQNGVPRNVFSPMRAKGLEFSRVLLYGFGEKYSKQINFKNGISSYQNYSDNERIPAEYLINKLYVALSRAQRRLFIADTEEGLENLWSFATNPKIQDSLLDKCDDKDTWKNMVGIIQEGKSDSGWSDDKENPQIIANQYFTEGRDQRDSYLLRQAALSYKITDNIDKQYECEAMALELDEKYKDSAEFFIKYKNFEKALDVLWKGCHYDEISRDITPKKFESILQVKISKAIVSTRKQDTEQDIDSLLAEFNEYLKSNITNEGFDIQVWEKAINILLDNTLNCKKIDLSSIYSRIKEFDSEISITNITQGYFANKAGEHSEALSYFEKANETKSLAYKESKLEVLKKTYESDTKKEFTSAEYDQLGSYYYEKGKYDLAAEIYYKVHNYDKLKYILDKCDLKANELINKIIKYYILSLIYHRKWNTIKIVYTDESLFKESIATSFEEKIDFYFDLLVSEIAQDLFIKDLSKLERDSISNLLRNKINFSKSKEWKNRLFPELVGAAFERVDIDKNTLDFYEFLLKTAEFDNETKKRARERWIKVKLKQADRIKNVKRKKEIKDEITKEVKEHKIDVNKIPEYPSLSGFLGSPPISKIIETESKPIKSFDHIPSFSIGSIEFKVNRDNRRINIENSENSYTASIKIDGLKCESTDFDFKKFNDTYYGEDIGVNISFHNKNNKEVKIEIIKLGIELLIAF